MKREFKLADVNKIGTVNFCFNLDVIISGFLLKKKINIKYKNIFPPKGTYIYILLAIILRFKDSLLHPIFSSHP